MTIYLALASSALLNNSLSFWFLVLEFTCVKISLTFCLNCSGFSSSSDSDELESLIGLVKLLKFCAGLLLFWLLTAAFFVFVLWGVDYYYEEDYTGWRISFWMGFYFVDICLEGFWVLCYGFSAFFLGFYLKLCNYEEELSSELGIFISFLFFLSFFSSFLSLFFTPTSSCVFFFLIFPFSSSLSFSTTRYILSPPIQQLGRRAGNKNSPS